MRDADLVARHYNSAAFDFENVRLTEHCPVEFAITKRFLDRWIPDGAYVAEIGVGVGHYSEHLAARGCRMHLIDVTERLLDAAAARLRGAGLEKQLLAASQLSATDLSLLETGVFDAVLLLGPLYHLRSLSERQRAVDESARVLKPEGLLYAAGINRMAYLREEFRERARLVTERREFHAQYMRDGNLDPEHAPPIGFAHLTTVDEFRALFQDRFQEVTLAGVESFTSLWQPVMHDLTPYEVQIWLDLVEQTAGTAEGLGQADHFLFVGKKLQPGAQHDPAFLERR